MPTLIPVADAVVMRAIRKRRRRRSLERHVINCDGDDDSRLSARGSERRAPVPALVPGSTVFQYSRGPGGAVFVAQSDMDSVRGDELVRDGVVDAVSRYLWQETLPPSQSARTHVFCSVFHHLLATQGPASVRAMTRRVDIFSLDTWVFLICEYGHWTLAVLSGVSHLRRDLARLDGGGGAPRAPRARLALLNSLKEAPQSCSRLYEWVGAEAVHRQLVRGQRRPGSVRSWVRACLSVSTPVVPQQGRENDCSMFTLSYLFAFFSASSEQRDALLLPGVRGRRAWEESFVLLSRSVVYFLCLALRDRDGGDHRAGEGPRSSSAPATSNLLKWAQDRAAAADATQDEGCPKQALRTGCPPDSAGEGQEAELSVSPLQSKVKPAAELGARVSGHVRPPRSDVQTLISALPRGAPQQGLQCAPDAEERRGTLRAADRRGLGEKGPNHSSSSALQTFHNTRGRVVAADRAPAGADADQAPRCESIVLPLAVKQAPPTLARACGSQTVESVIQDGAVVDAGRAGLSVVLRQAVVADACRPSRKEDPGAPPRTCLHRDRPPSTLEADRAVSRSLGFARGSLLAHTRACAGTHTTQVSTALSVTPPGLVEGASTERWLECFCRWRVGFEPAVALDVIKLLQQCALMSPTLIEHYARGLAKWRPPVTRVRLEPWFELMLTEDIGTPDDGRRRRHSATFFTRVHAIFYFAYACYGRVLPRAEDS